MNFVKDAPNKMDTAAAMPTCYLLSIPQELRDMIYHYALTADSSIYIWGNTWTSDGEKTKIPGVSLLRTCKQIHGKAAHLLFKNNSFAISFNIGGEPHTTHALSGVVWEHSMPWCDEPIAHTMVGKQVPLEKIRYLDLQLSTSEIFDQHGMLTSSAWHLLYHLQDNFRLCLNECAAMQKLRVVTMGWNAQRYIEFGNQTLMDGLVNHAHWIEIDPLYRFDVEFVQSRKDGDELWLSEESKKIIEGWTTKKVTFVIE